jgi:hypothetical protein
MYLLTTTRPAADVPSAASLYTPKRTVRASPTHPAIFTLLRPLTPVSARLSRLPGHILAYA